MTIRVLASLSAVVGIGLLTAVAWTQQPGPASQRGDGGGFPDLVGGLKQVEGCLGVETARTSKGKNLIFAWFEDKKAVARWYHSEAHQGVMDAFVGADGYAGHKPMSHVPDDAGPILVIASLTPSAEPQHKGLNMPVSQIAVEIYQPLPGGVFIAGRFAPDSVKVEHMRDLTPLRD